MTRWLPTPTALTLTDGATRRVDGYVTDAAPGLVVTPALAGPDESPETLARAPWAVTHRDSGRRIVRCGSLAEAQAAALHLAERADWTPPVAVLQGSPTLRGVVAGARERVGVAG